MRCVTDHDERVLRQGEAVFVPAADGWARIAFERSSDIVYAWAERSAYARPFVTDVDARSQSVVTIDLDDSVPQAYVTAALRGERIAIHRPPSEPKAFCGEK
mgnify:CR=1 FL=1